MGDLSEFVKACKFGMMTTRDGSSGALVSRCMALAAQVRDHFFILHLPPLHIQFCVCVCIPVTNNPSRKPVALTSSSTPTPPSLTAPANGPPSPAKPPSSPTVTPSRNTTRPLSSTMVPRTILESVLSELRL